LLPGRAAYPLLPEIDKTHDLHDDEFKRELHMLWVRFLEEDLLGIVSAIVAEPWIDGENSKNRKGPE